MTLRFSKTAESCGVESESHDCRLSPTQIFLFESSIPVIVLEVTQFSEELQFPFDNDTTK